MHELKRAIISGFYSLGPDSFDVLGFVGYVHLEQQRQFRQSPGKPADVRIPIGNQNFYMGLTVAPSTEDLEVRLVGPDEKTLCSLSREGILRFGGNTHFVDPNEAVQEMIEKVIGGNTRYDFLQ